MQYAFNADGTDATPQTLAEFIAVQFADGICPIAIGQLGQAGTEFIFNKDGVLVKRASIDGAIQKLLSQSLQ